MLEVESDFLCQATEAITTQLFPTTNFIYFFKNFILHYFEISNTDKIILTNLLEFMAYTLAKFPINFYCIEEVNKGNLLFIICIVFDFFYSFVISYLALSLSPDSRWCI